MTSTIRDIGRSADTGTPSGPPPSPSYSPENLPGEAYLGLWSAGKIAAGPMVDPEPEGAVRAAADLLRAFGTPTVVPAAGPQVTAAAVARVCAVAA